VEKSPVPSTYCSDPDATHTVSTADPHFGYGIFGYYTCEMDAFRVRKYLLKNHCRLVRVEDYNPSAEVEGGINPLVDAHINGYC
jgi:hypothetical protein